MGMGIEVLGPIALRKFHLAAICETSVGHKHNYDHVTFVQRGRIKVIYRLTEDGPEQTSKEFATGELVLIKAEVFHTIKALEPNTQYSCVFTHRDFDSGETIQQYNGNPDAVT